MAALVVVLVGAGVVAACFPLTPQVSTTWGPRGSSTLYSRYLRG